METKNVCIATARINGLEKRPYYFDAKCYFAMEIMFSEPSTLYLKNLPFIFLDDESLENAEKELSRIRSNFKEARINDNDNVAVLFSREHCEIIAIGSLGCDLWIDVQHQFALKKFEELNIVITGLTIY